MRGGNKEEQKDSIVMVNAKRDHDLKTREIEGSACRSNGRHGTRNSGLLVQQAAHTKAFDNRTYLSW